MDVYMDMDVECALEDGSGRGFKSYLYFVFISLTVIVISGFR